MWDEQPRKRDAVRLAGRVALPPLLLCASLVQSLDVAQREPPLNEHWTLVTLERQILRMSYPWVMVQGNGRPQRPTAATWALAEYRGPIRFTGSTMSLKPQEGVCDLGLWRKVRRFLLMIPIHTVSAFNELLFKRPWSCLTT